MDRRLLRYYERELLHLREMGGEFARDFPKVAGRLALDEFACADPYVERLLEGFAFMAARVQLKLDAEFPRFTQSLLETVYPHYLAPTPSMTVVQLNPDPNEGSLGEGYDVPRGTGLRSLLGKGEQTACEYRTAHDVTLLPIRIAEAKYLTRDLASLEIPNLGAVPGGVKAAIRLRIACTASLTFDKVKLDRLCLYLRGAGDLQMRLYEQLFAHGAGVVVQPTGRPVPWREMLPATSIRRVGFEDELALLPAGPRSFQGYRLLHEYFAFPQRFLFVELAGLQKGVQRSGPVSELDVIVLLRQPDLTLENAIDASNFAPFCTPAINLFPKRTDRIHLGDRSVEFQIIPDRTRPRDFEVYQVGRVTGHGARTDQEQDFTPFYRARDGGDGEGAAGGGAYFTVNRVPRALSEKEQRQGQRSHYAGSEVYLSLVDAKNAPYRADLRQLSVETLCTNRDLSLFLPIGRGESDFTVDSGAPLQSVRCVSGVPTAPRPSHAEGETAWRIISHLSLNYLSLVDDAAGGQGAGGLRELLKLYGDLAEAHVRKQIEGIKSVASKPLTRRVATPGPIAFARGLEVTLTLDEAMFEGSGVFLLGAVLEEFFARYVSINSFTETVVRTPDRGEVMRWGARIGRRQAL